MKREINVYNFEKRKKRIKEILDTLPPKNKNDIERFCMNLLTEGKAEATYFKYLERLPQIAFLLNKEFKKVTQEDLERVFEKLITEHSYAKNTIGTYKIMTRRFFQWIYGYKKHQYPPVVEWIEANVHHKKLIRPEDLLTGEDIQKMIAVAFNPRDKAFIAVLAESGGRISEVLTLRIKNITFDNIGAVFVLTGKTGQRICRVINAVPYLQAWLKHHPEKNDPEAPLWVVLGNCKDVAKNGLCKDYKHVWRYNLGYAAARSMLKKVAQRAGITKPVNPHNYRHSRVTTLAVSGINSAILNEIFGWSQNSSMASTYLHISRQQTEENRNKDSGLLKKLGITATCLVPLMATASLRGYFDSQGMPMIESQALTGVVKYGTLIPAIGFIGQVIPFRFDNMDPGCLTTLLAIPLGIGLNNLCYSIDYSLGSMNK